MKGHHPPKKLFDLGLAISGATMKHGQRRTNDDIACFINAAGAHCSGERIRQIEQRALRKLRIKAHCKNPVLLAALEHLSR